MIGRLLLAISAVGFAGVTSAQAPAPPPEVLVAQAASAYGAIDFGRADEERALGDLAEALRQDPANAGARKLLEAIQKRRQERQEQQEQQGQQEREQQQSQQAAEQQEEQSEEEKQADDEAGGDEEQPEQPEEQGETPQPEPSEEDGEQMSQEEAERLLDALEQQEKGPAKKAPRRRPRHGGPRW